MLSLPQRPSLSTIRSCLLPTETDKKIKPASREICEKKTRFLIRELSASSPKTTMA